MAAVISPHQALHSPAPRPPSPPRRAPPCARAFPNSRSPEHAVNWPPLPSRTELRGRPPQAPHRKNGVLPHLRHPVPPLPRLFPGSGHRCIAGVACNRRHGPGCAWSRHCGPPLGELCPCSGARVAQAGRAATNCRRHRRTGRPDDPLACSARGRRRGTSGPNRGDRRGLDEKTLTHMNSIDRTYLFGSIKVYCRGLNEEGRFPLSQYLSG
jgi:hypothetical protein